MLFSSPTGPLHWYLPVVYKKSSHPPFAPCLSQCNPSGRHSGRVSCIPHFFSSVLRPLLYRFSCHAPGLFFRAFRVFSLVLSYWSCLAMHKTYSSVPLNPLLLSRCDSSSILHPLPRRDSSLIIHPLSLSLQLQSHYTPTLSLSLQLQSHSTPTVPLQLPLIGRSAYFQTPAASHSLVYKLHFDFIQVE